MAIALSLTACVAQKEVRYTREDGNWVRTDLPAFIHRDHPVLGSDASRTALRDCEQRVTSTTRELAEGHLAFVGAMPSRSRPKGVDADTFKAGLLFCLLNPFCWPYAPPLARMQRDWTPEQAAARESMAREIGQCMDEQGWIYCTWHQERSGLSMGYAGKGWLCRRKRLDDPQPD